MSKTKDAVIDDMNERQHLTDWCLHEAKRIHGNFLIDSPALAEVELLIDSLASALEWGLEEEKTPEMEKCILYFSNLSLDENLNLIATSLGVNEQYIITSTKRDYCLARSVFCYISSNRHSSIDIGNFLGKNRNTVRFSVDLVRGLISMKNSSVLNMLNLIFNK